MLNLPAAAAEGKRSLMGPSSLVATATITGVKNTQKMS